MSKGMKTLLNSLTPSESEEITETEELPLPSNSGFVAVKRCKFDGTRLEVGDTVPQNWSKKVIADFLDCKAIKAK